MECKCYGRTKGTSVRIYYCPLHKAAPALCEALKAMRVFYETGDMDFQKVKLDVLSALAEAEGK